MKSGSKQLGMYDDDDDDIEDDDSEYRHYLRRRRREKARRKELEMERARAMASGGTVPRDIYPYSDEDTLSLYSETTLSWEARCNGGGDVRFCGMAL